MKAILISIKPEWIEKIFNSEKTIEIRKTKPNCELPIKVYIYCTKPKRWFIDSPFTIFSYEELWIQDNKIYNGKEDSLWNPKFNHYYHLNGRVVAEFTLNEIEVIKSIREKRNGSSYQYHELNDRILKQSCLSEEQILDYTNGNDLYGWHIDNLKVYDKPKELSEFGIKRAFQSWGYISE